MTSDAVMPLTVGDLLDRRAKDRGHHPLLICDDQVLEYVEAAEQSANLARGLIGSGLARGSRIGLLYPNSAEFVVASLAAARIGAITVPLSTFSAPSELRGLLCNASVDTLIATAGYRRHDYVDVLRKVAPELDLHTGPPLLSPSVPSLRMIAFDAAHGEVESEWTVQSILRNGNAVSFETLDAAQSQVSPSDPLVIVHTSGSTAEPKGVIHTHASLVGHLHVLNHLRDYRGDDILFCNSPFFWIGGYSYSLLGTLEAGGTLVCSNATDPSDVLDVIERAKPTMVNGFAQSVAHLAEDPSFPKRDLSSIKRGNLYPIMPAAVRPADPELFHNMLGMTETGSVCLASADETEQPERRRGSFGRPVSDIEAKVIDPESGSARSHGEVGELCLRGSPLMTGYCRRERHETFDADGWYHTGDLFHVDEEGFFYFHGRRSEMIKTSGANVSPREVETAIFEEIGLVAHVFGVDDQMSGQLVAAVIVAPPAGTVPDPAELTTRLRNRLSAYKVPKRIVVIDETDRPMMSSGKVDMRALRERVNAG